jgi:hypothetical protein
MRNNVMIGAISKGSYERKKNALIKKFDVDTRKIFTSYNKEVKAKGLSTIAETNKLWRSKYAPKLDKIEKIHDEEYKVLWNSYHRK